MKKIMCAAFVAAMALVSCHKEPVATQSAQQGEMKAVTINLSNVETLAKSTSTAGDLKGQKATLSNFQVFFTNTLGDKFYKGKNANGTDAAHYFTRTAALETFHFLSAEVTRVIVVANLGVEKAPANVTELMGYTTAVADQQEINMNNLVMFGEVTSLQETGDHTSTHPSTKIYRAEVKVKPLIARVEVLTFGVNFAKNSLFKSVQFDKLAFDNYFPNARLDGTVSGERIRQEFVNLTDPVALKSAQSSFFSAMTGASWNGDLIDASQAEANIQPVSVAREIPSDPAADSPAQEKSQTLSGHRYAYNFFPVAAATTFEANGYPRLYVQVTATNNQDVATPHYIMTRNFTSETSFTGFMAGNIYRVSLVFPDSLLSEPLICTDVNIDVVPWDVVELTSEW